MLSSESPSRITERMVVVGTSDNQIIIKIKDWIICIVLLDSNVYSVNKPDFLLLKKFPGFPGGSVVENSPANAGDTGSMLDPGRSHMLWSNLVCVAQLQSLCSRAWEPKLLSPRPQNPCSAIREATEVRNPHTQLESSPRSNKDPAQPESNNSFKKVRKSEQSIKFCFKKNTTTYDPQRFSSMCSVAQSYLTL